MDGAHAYLRPSSIFAPSFPRSMSCEDGNRNYDSFVIWIGITPVLDHPTPSTLMIFNNKGYSNLPLPPPPPREAKMIQMAGRESHLSLRLEARTGMHSISIRGITQTELSPDVKQMLASICLESRCTISYLPTRQPNIQQTSERKFAPPRQQVGISRERTLRDSIHDVIVLMRGSTTICQAKPRCQNLRGFLPSL